MGSSFIIAEAGINHNGKFSKALEMIEEAKDAGADAVKFQTFWNIDLGKKYQFSKRQFINLKAHCNQIGIEFMSTPHTFEAIHFLDRLVNRYKVASTYVPNINFLKEVASKNKPILISTGSLITYNKMMLVEDVHNALEYIKGADVTLLHCVSEYPPKNPYYKQIDRLKLLGYPVGLSDHSKVIEVPKGLPVYEKHFMLEGMDCIDKDVSLTPKEFKRMVEWITH